MPVSHTYQISKIMEAVILCEPKKVLEIGVGFGKYGVLCYERLNLWWHGKNTEDYKQKKVILDGIEIYKPYKNPLHKFIYDKVYYGDALKVIKKFKDNSYDLILAIDVLEHFNEKDGKALLNLCKKISKNILISTPKVYNDQEQHFGNEAEIHKYHWSEEEYNKFFGEKNIFIEDKLSTITFFGSEIEKVSNKSYFEGI